MQENLPTLFSALYSDSYSVLKALSQAFRRMNMEMSPALLLDPVSCVAAVVQNKTLSVVCTKLGSDNAVLLRDIGTVVNGVIFQTRKYEPANMVVEQYSETSKSISTTMYEEETMITITKALEQISVTKVIENEQCESVTLDLNKGECAEAKYLVVATESVWRVIRNDDLKEAVKSSITENEIAEKITTKAIVRGCIKDIAIAVINLEKFR